MDTIRKRVVRSLKTRLRILFLYGAKPHRAGKRKAHEREPEGCGEAATVHRKSVRRPTQTANLTAQARKQTTAKEKTARERPLSKNDMDRLKRAAKYFTPFELLLWAGSLTVIAVFYGVFDGEHPMNLAASLIGATSLIFAAKGNPFAQLLLIVFSVLYGIISWTYAYYGEMITYLGMSAPIAVLALISWLRHPFAGKHSEVRVNHVSMKEHIFLWVLTAAVTAAFYFILKVLDTANLIPSTVSVATSFLAAYLTFRRSPLYAVAYAANDIVLIVLWVMATLDDIGYISVVVCFVIFLANDLYGFFNWTRMRRRQSAADAKTPAYTREKTRAEAPALNAASD